MAARTTILRAIHVGHRWLGMTLGLMVLLWFVSGLVMLFVARPALTEDERIAALPVFGPAEVGLSPLAAWQALGLPGAPEAVRLNAAGGSPHYHFLALDRWWSVDAASGVPRAALAAAAAIATARRFAGGDADDGAVVSAVDVDQWTVYRRFDAWRPFLRVDLADERGRALYVSQRTGEVVLDTDRGERGWNWVGSVVHWLYFTPLRQMGEVWRGVVLWLSFGALLLALGGVILGWQRLRLRHPYPDGRVTPYRERWKRWHHLVGLVGGVFVLAWLFSGWLSLAPFGWLKGSAASAAERRLLAGGSLDAATLQLRPSVAAAEVQWLHFAGVPYALLLDADGSRLQRLDRVAELLPELELSAVLAQARGLRPDARVHEAVRLTAADADYYPRRHRPRRLPVIRVVFDDPARTAFYIDPASTRIEARVDAAGRRHRWLFDALHTLDLPPLDPNGAMRNVLVILLSVPGIVLATAGCVLAWRRLRRSRGGRRDEPLRAETGRSRALGIIDGGQSNPRTGPLASLHRRSGSLQSGVRSQERNGEY